VQVERPLLGSSESVELPWSFFEEVAREEPLWEQERIAREVALIECEWAKEESKIDWVEVLQRYGAKATVSSLVWLALMNGSRGAF